MTNNLPANIQNLHDVIQSERTHFEVALVDEKIAFVREADFAIQHLRKNTFLAGVASRNPQSLRDAIRNVAAIGISLNPADKHAYLVPRDNQVCLDIGYMGLIHLATESGAIEWIQAKHVHEKDTYTNNGVDKAPTHDFQAFGDRGKVVGVYCVAKTATGAYLTTEMTIDEVDAIKKRSAAANKGFSPWKSDEGAMQLKTVVKKAYKFLPRSERLAKAIDYLNTDAGQGIDFDAQRRQYERSTGGDLNPTPDQRKTLLDLMERTSTDCETFLGYFANTIAKRDITDIDALTGREADQAIGLLKQKHEQLKAKGVI